MRRSTLVGVLVTAIVDSYAREASPLQAKLASREQAAPDVSYSGDVSSCSGYQLSSVHETSSSLTAKLSLVGLACNAFGQDIKDLTIAVSYESKTRLHVNIFDTARKQFTVPTDIITPPGTSSGSSKTKSELVFNYESSPFAFWITRRSQPDTTPLFDTRITSLPKTPVPAVRDDKSIALDGFPLVFENGYIQLTSALPLDTNLYGLGEIVASAGLRRAMTGNGTIQTNWARDVADPIDENEYGVYPFYLEHRLSANNESSSHGVFLNSAAGADILLMSPPSSNVSVIEYRMLGGTLDFYFFAGPSSQAVVEQYSEVAGKPIWTPLWAFGLHLCRWGWSGVDEVKSVAARMREANIPLEVMWNDIDIYHAYRDFTLDPTAYPADEVKAYIQSLHDNNQHFIPIVDAAIPRTIPNGTDSYDPYDKGASLGVFVTNPDGSEYLGKAWPGYTVYPDYFAPNTTAWWTEALLNWTKQGVDFDGIWLDMNEASSFCEGSCGTGLSVEVFGNTSTPFILPGEPGHPITDWPECYNATIYGTSGNITVNGTLTCDISTVSQTGLAKRGIGAAATPDVDVNTPRYTIHNPLADLSVNTIAVNASHHGGVLEYDAHSLYGTMETIATNKALHSIRPGKRPFIITRSTYAGVGKYAGHWLGDNFSQWAYLHYMIQGVLQFQMFQVPMVGADSCGFNGNTDEELCNRWMQAAAFTPFYRNHNEKGAISQEPYVWDSVAEATRVAVHERLRMLPYWYTLFANASLRGTPPVRPLFFEFPNEPELFDVDEQFLVGRDILVTPVLLPNVTTVVGYFPGHGRAQWRDWFTHKVVASSNEKVTLDAPLGHINVHIRDGSTLLLFAEPKYTVKETSDGPYELLVHLAKDGYAHGTAYVDDGESYPPGPSRDIVFSAMAGKLSVSSTGKYNVTSKLSKVTILGVGSKPESIKVGGKPAKFGYDAEVQRVVLAGLDLDLNGDVVVTWS